MFKVMQNSYPAVQLAEYGMQTRICVVDSACYE